MRGKITTVLALAGLVLALGSSALASSLVTNGGFETGDFTGWTLGGDTSVSFVSTDPGFTYFVSAHSGSNKALFGPGSTDNNGNPILGTLSQAIATVSGDSYTVSFWLANDSGPTDVTGSPCTASCFPPYGNDFVASWNGSTLTAMTDANAFGWTQYSYNVTGAAGSTPLEFTFFNYGGYFYMDDISVTDNGPISAPEPGSLMLMGSGLLGLGGMLRRRAKK